MEINQVVDLLRSTDGSARLSALRWMRENVTDLPDDCLELAAGLIEDADNDCRWQAFIVVGEYIARSPHRVWELVCKYGVSPDEDMRDAAAAVLLEHLLGHDFNTFMPKLKAQVDFGHVTLLDTLQRSWPMDLTAEERQQVVEYFRLKGVDPGPIWLGDTEHGPVTNRATKGDGANTARRPKSG